MKNGKFSTKVLVWLLCAVMLVGLTPMTVFAAAGSNGLFSQSQLSLVTDKQSTLASGVTQNAYTVYDKNGNQVKMFAATIDMSVDTVKLFTSYKDMDNTSYGLSKLTEQVAAFEKKAAAGDEYYHGTVVAGINASYYNMTTGKPSGVFVMNGNDVTGNDKSAYFAVLKDGTVKIGNADEYANDKGNIQEALGIYKMLVFDGKIVLSDADQKNTQKYPRQTIGITEDNKVILLSADGNQEPASIGLTLMEQAQVMLDLGCKWAGHLDGGGSMTYGSKPEGEDSFKIVNKPSDGSERSISNGLIVVSTAAASKVFDHVSFDVETEYATPGTPVEVSVSGVSSTGHAAEIPADITYKVTNGTYENGVLIADSVGDVILTAVYNGKECGSVTVHAVIPDKLAFNSSEMTVPYGKTVTLALTATYGLNEVKIKANDIQFTLENDGIGTIDGFDFTAGDGSVTESSITATFVGTTDVVATSNIGLGKGSEVIYDFEDGNVSDFDLGYGKFNYVLPEGKVYPVTAATGKVHSGNGAMALDINYGNSLESGYMMTALAYLGKEQKFENATKLGMWIYISDEDVSTWIRYTVFPLELNDDGEYVQASGVITNTLADCVASTTGFVNQYQEPGWHYLSIDLSAYKGLDLLGNYYIVQFYISDRDGAAYNYYYNQHKSYNGRYVMYVDDITVDYSDAVDDREAPVFGDVTYATGSMSDAAVLNGQTVSENVLSFGVKVADNTKKNNFTGLNIATAKAYIDGVETACTYKDGVMSLSDVTLADGMHHVKFSICDNQGNYASVIREINVQANSGKSTIKVVAHDPSLDKILLGSVWYADIVATDIEKVQSVVVDIDLNNMSKWELDHMTVAAGFEASYSIQDDENIATITLTRTGINEQTGEGVLASLPIRTWELKMGYTYTSGTKSGQPAYTYAQFKSMKEFWPIDISMEIDRGLVTFIDGTTDTFSGEGPQVDTEMYKMAKDMISTAEGKAYYNSWNGGHIHTAEALADKAATCTETGYTGRTFCEVCNSVVDWGTTIPATGHEYELIDGQFVCKKCSDVYDAGSGLFEMNGTYYYAVGGVLQTGWIEIDGAWHYFGKDYAAVTGEYYYASRGITYQFDETGKTDGVWQKTKYGTRFWYGQWYYTARNEYQKQFVEIDGKTYNFDVNGYMCTGIHALYDDWSSLMRGEMQVWEFDDDGSLIKQITDKGIVDNKRGGLYLIEEDGYVHGGTAHLVSYNGDLYFVCYSGKLKQNGHQQITAANSNNLVKPGVYEFGADGKMLPLFTGVRADETGTLYYYIEGSVCSGVYNSELVEIDGSVYLVKWSGKVAANETRVVIAAKTNGLVDAGVYNFGADGKLIPPVTEVKDNGNGILYYYRDGKIVSAEYDSELVEINGAIYLVKWSGKVAVNETLYIANSKANGLMKSGYYSFGADGKLILPFTGVKDDGTGTLYYYMEGSVCSGVYNSELVEIDGSVYLVKWSGKVAANETRVVIAAKTNGLVDAGVYNFGADGKLIPPVTEVKDNGNGILYYYRDGKIVSAEYDSELVEINGAIYLVKWSGKVAVNETLYIANSKANGLVKSGYYSFDSDGKLILPFTGVKDDGTGTLYYYENGMVRSGVYNSELVDIGGFIYFVKWSGKVASNEYRTVTAKISHGLLPNGRYYFGADGKLVSEK